MSKYFCMSDKKSKNSGKSKREKTSGLKEKTKKKIKEEIPPEILEKRRKLVARIIGVLLIFLGIFLFVCFFLPYSTGMVGKWLFEKFNYLFGWGAYLFPLILFYIGIQLTIKGSKFSWNWLLLFIVLLYVDAVILVHFIMEKGGILGGYLGGHILQIIGRVGGYLVLIFIGLVSLMLLTQLTVKQLLKGIYSLISLMGKAIEKAWKFLTFKSADEEKEKQLLDAEMDEIPDLATVVKDGKTREKTRVESEEYEEDEIDDEPEEDDEEDREEESDQEPKKVVFFDEKDFEEDEDEEEEPEPDTQTSSTVSSNDTSEEDMYFLPNELDGMVEEEEPLPPTSPLDGDTFEMTGGKPTGYEQLNLFGEGKTKKTAKKEEAPKKPVRNYKYRLPPLNLLRSGPKEKPKETYRDDSKILEETLANFGVQVKVINIIHGPAVTRYELQPAKGVKVRKVTNLTNDIALALAAYSIRIEAPIPGKSAIGIEVPNRRIEPVFLRDLFYDAKYKKLSPLSLALGKDITGKAVVGELLKMPHLLVAGATGSGKSVCVNSIIASILYKATPLDVQLVMVDPKRVELSLYEGIPHLVDIKLPGDKKIITDPKAATLALKTLSEIMDLRYEDFVALKVRNIKEYNEKAEEPIPYIVIIIDELADLMMVSSSTVEQYICRIAQLGRASGIHLLIATQRPSVDVITGLIKANIPSRIAFAVSSQVDSRTILDRVGAEKLLGKGDMLYLPVDASEPRRIQGAFVSGEEVEKVVEFWKKQPPPENIIPIEISEAADKGSLSGVSDDEDELIPDAIEIIKTTRQASVSNLQRKMKIGYARAGRIMDQLEQRGVVGPAQGSKPRKILLPGFTDLD